MWDTREQLFPGAAKSESPQYICRGCEKLLLRISKEEDELGQLKKKVKARSASSCLSFNTTEILSAAAAIAALIVARRS